MNGIETPAIVVKPLFFRSSGTLVSSHSVNENPITDEGLTHLAGLRSLEILHLRGTKASYDGIARLKREIPGLKINP